MFWKEKQLNQMNSDEWESLCDRCGKCCSLKLQDEISNEIFDTSLVCKLFDVKKCNCKNYSERHQYVKDCIKLSDDNIRSISWLPNTCAYKLVSEGKDLYPWHHLNSGSYETIHETGNSIISSEIKSESEVERNDYEDYITNKITSK